MLQITKNYISVRLMKIQWAFGEVKDQNFSVSQHETTRKTNFTSTCPENP